MSKFWHDNAKANDSKPWVFSENTQAKNGLLGRAYKVFPKYIYLVFIKSYLI